MADDDTHDQWVLGDHKDDNSVIRDMGAERVMRDLVAGIDDQGSGVAWEQADWSDQHPPTWTPPIIDNPAAALDMHLSQWQWCGSEKHLEATTAFMKSYYATRDRIKHDTVDIFAGQEKLMLARGVTHFVSPDVSDVLVQIAKTMPPDMLQEADLPMRNGFIVLGKPWEYLNFEAGTYTGKIPIRAICWEKSDWVGQPDGTMKPGVYVYLYADRQWIESINGELGDGWKQPLIHCDMWAWTLDTWWEERTSPDQEADLHHASPHVGEMRRNLLALWRFMEDEIVLTRRNRMPRSSLRRWGRSGLDVPEDGSIVTIHLRRIRSHQDDADAQPIDWTHRWWVNGHKRYNPKTGKKDIWVRPYLKGPEGLPIVVKKKVVVVDR